MGSEALCAVRWAGQTSEGKALLETKELIFRGSFRLRIAFDEISSLESEAGQLRVGYRGEVAVFELGRNAAAWAAKIQNPRGLLDKLGVKSEMRVAVLGVEDEVFAEELRAREIDTRTPAEGSLLDMVFFEADRAADLARLPALRAAIVPSGAIWVVSPKGKAAELKDSEVMAAARAAGLVDTKVVGFSDTHTALKLVIPRSER